ncbi:MAG: IS1182 family transposase [Nanoarchaeota archaeon]|nr:IS1182 family transposase [Nanoarchaeota archaeon]
MAYIQSFEGQNWLLPLSIKDIIPKDHICFLVENFVNSLDFSKFDEEYDGVGAPAYHPRISLKILIQGMLSKVRSSRKLAAASRENLVFMYLGEKTKPNFRTIARFRMNNASFVKEAFKKTVELAASYNLIDLSLICVDGTFIKANASKKRTIKREVFDILDKAVERMIEEDIALDKLEEEMYGDSEENLTGMDRKDMKRIVDEYKKCQDKKKIEEIHKRVKKELDCDPNQKKLSLTDPESRMMTNKKRNVEPSYNAQFSVDAKHQIILANDVCQDGHDANQLIPQIENIEENIGKLPKGTKIGADCSYSSGNNFQFLEKKKLEGYIPSRAQAQELNGKEQTLNHDMYEYDWDTDEIILDGVRLQFHKHSIRKDGKEVLLYKTKDWSIRRQVPALFRERLRMKTKMQTAEAKEIYNRRKIVVEPPIGDIKENLGFREFLLRGMNSVKTELNLVSIAHNLKKVWIKKKEVGMRTTFSKMLIKSDGICC